MSSTKLEVRMVTYRNATRGGPSQGHWGHAQKFDEDRFCGSGDIHPEDGGAKSYTKPSTVIFRNDMILCLVYVLVVAVVLQCVDYSLNYGCRGTGRSGRNTVIV